MSGRRTGCTHAHVWLYRLYGYMYTCISAESDYGISAVLSGRNRTLNITSVEVRLPCFRLKSSRFVKLVQYNSYLTTVVEALNPQISRLLMFLRSL